MIQTRPSTTEEWMDEGFSSTSGSSPSSDRTDNLGRPKKAVSRDGSKRRVYSVGSTSDPHGKRETRLTPLRSTPKRPSTHKRVVQAKESEDLDSFEFMARQAERSRTYPEQLTLGSKGKVGMRWVIGLGMIALVVLFGFIRLSGSSAGSVESAASTLEPLPPQATAPAQKATAPVGHGEAKKAPVADPGPAVSTPEKEAAAAPIPAKESEKGLQSAEGPAKGKAQLVAQAKAKPAKGKKALHRKKGKRLARAHRSRG